MIQNKNPFHIVLAEFNFKFWQKVLDFLKEQGSSEEYQESLDLIDRLIKTRDKNAAVANTGIILSVIGNVELLLGTKLTNNVIALCMNSMDYILLLPVCIVNYHNKPN